MQIVKVEKGSCLWEALAEYAEHTPWAAGKHLADMLRKERFSDWESVFAALEDDKIVGYCTFLKEDYYPDHRYSPWISTIFVDPAHRGRRVSQRMIETAMAYAKTQKFTRVYIPSDMVGFYEKYGFVRIDELTNYGGDVDQIFARDIK